MLGKHRQRKINPPVYPIHPNEEKKKNLNNFITYKDLKIRWKNTSKRYRKKVTIARKWKNLHCLLPFNKNSCIFILHKNLPFTRLKNEKEWQSTEKIKEEFETKQTKEKNEKNEKNENDSNELIHIEAKNKINEKCVLLEKKQDINYNKIVSIGRKKKKKKNKFIENMNGMSEQGVPIESMSSDKSVNYYETPPSNMQHIINKDKNNLFCIFKSNFINEHKVTIGDIVQTEKLHRKKAGDVIYFGTVLLAGSKNFTIVGKPTIPYCKVKATIEQITLSKEILSFRYKKVRRSSRFLRIRHWITILKIDDIIINTEQKETNYYNNNNNNINNEITKKPLQILDLWANRWLYQKELNFIKFDKNNNPMAEQIYNLLEHQPNTLHRRGLTDCYRFYPDPQIPNTY
ncbi:mitochondrial ribosomal protein L21 precursor, putative [Hepatocystis sp. ex Piliocolobus tephrosceles]|nr:mitochondrial ribosomal protein L21 precursor, putative [Hepatocystis sp. ex Piliocolobus tephrosceles]